MNRTLLTAATLLCLLAPAAVGAQEAAPAKLAITQVTVEPQAIAADTLCKLRVTVRNDGDEIASQLGFDVRLNGQSLTVYDNQLFMYAVPAGGELEIPLYNFWSTETSRPEMPGNGKYVVEVDLREAQWMDISMEKEMVERAGEQVEEEVEVWTPLGAIEALPVSGSASLTVAGG